MALSAKLITIGIDWLTLTTKESTRGVEWHEAFDACAAQEQKLGHKWLDARRMMYQGESCSGLFWGKSEQGWMVVLSSHCAHEYGALFSPDAVHCTRVDLQVTADLAVQSPDLIERTYEACAAWHPANGRPPKYGLVKATDGSRTLYVGSRTSMLFGRVYDKGVEQKDTPPGRRIRYEVEVKGEYADQMIAFLWRSSDQEYVILKQLGEYFAQRHIVVPWSYERPDEKLTLQPVTADDVGSLRWLRGPVASVVERLLGTVGAEEVFTALFSRATHLLDRDIMQGVVDLIVPD